MSVEYDLVIIGYTLEGVYAALTAVSVCDRVALVSQNCQGDCNPLYSYSLSDLAKRCYRWNELAKLGISGSMGEINLQQAISRIENAIATISEQNSPEILSAAGVDFIEGIGEFCRRPRLAFIVEGRKLRSRSYLLATGTRPLLPELKSVREIGYLTPDRLWKSQKLQQLPPNLAIVGGSSLALELAQSLTRLDKKVTLVMNGKILPQEEPEAARIIQAQLEGEGIELFAHSPVTQAKKIAKKKWLQVGDRAIETDEIIWAVGCQLNLDGLNLEALGIDPKSTNINLKQQ
ncbi:MAG: FAD-dependent oxidoreductase, partial [Spirulina sp.]